MNDKDNKSQIELLTTGVRKLAAELGFYSCGFVEAQALPENGKRLKEWLGAGLNAGMTYMGNHFEKRVDPRKLVEGARTVIVLLHNYYPGETTNEDNSYVIARYALGEDYHDVLKMKLKKIISFLEEYDPNVSARGFTDSAPVLEKAWAEKAGLGWIGKNTLLITKDHGSWFFISEIITSQEFNYDSHQPADHCGTCNLCIEACPAGALQTRKLDANKCISYWTIEQREGGLPESLKEKFGNRVYGCDICQEVCPWNKKAIPTKEPAFIPDKEISGLSKAGWEEMKEEDFERIFSKSPVKRLTYKGLKRNVNFVRENIP